MTSNNKSTLPELKQVIVAYNEKIVMKNSLSDALYALFGESTPKQPENTTQTLETGLNTEITYEDVVKAVIESFNGVKESSSSGDWQGFGKHMSELEKSINELEKNKKSSE